MTCGSMTHFIILLWLFFCFFEIQHEIWVEDGNTAAKVIQNARDNAKQRMKL